MILVVGTALFLFLPKGELVPKEEEEVNLAWQVNYKEAIKRNNISSEFLEETTVFDFSSINPNIIRNIETSAFNEKDAIRRAAELVVRDVDYQSNLDANICVSSTASSTLNSGFGNCASMSMTLTGILRAMGFAAYSAEGCLTYPYTCQALFAVTTPKKPPIPEIKDFLKRGGGFLHQWVEVYVTTESGGMELILVDPTSAEILDVDCQDYNFNQINDNSQDICISNDLPFAFTCLGGGFDLEKSI